MHDAQLDLLIPASTQIFIVIFLQAPISSVFQKVNVGNENHAIFGMFSLHVFNVLPCKHRVRSNVKNFVFAVKILSNV